MRDGIAVSRMYPQPADTRGRVEAGGTCMCVVQRPSQAFLVSGGRRGILKMVAVAGEQTSVQPKALGRFKPEDGAGKVVPAHQAPILAVCAAPGDVSLFSRLSAACYLRYFRTHSWDGPGPSIVRREGPAPNRRRHRACDHLGRRRDASVELQGVVPPARGQARPRGILRGLPRTR